MPQLPRFTAQIGDGPISGGRRASVDDFGAPSSLGGAVSKAAEAFLSDIEEQESRKALVASSEIRAKYARALDEAALSDTDTGRLKEQMQDELSKVGDNFQTRRGAQSLQLYTSNTELMFDEQANKIRVVRAAATARLEGSKFLNSASEIIRSNPDYLKHAEGDAEAFVSTLKNVSPEQRLEIARGLKKELNMAAAVSAARVDPEAAKKRLEQGEWDLTPQQREAAVGKADQQIEARRVAQIHERNTKEFERKQRDEAATRKFTDDIIKGTLTGRALEKALTEDPDLDAASVQNLTRFAEYRAKELVTTEKKSNPTVMRDLWLRIHAPDGDPRKIYNGDAIFAAVGKGQLNTTDANQLNTLVANQKDGNNRSFGVRLQGRINTVAAAMRGSAEYSAQPELSAAIQLELAAQVEKRAARLRADNKDPDVLLDPESKDYYFKPGLIKSVAEDVKRQRDALSPKAVTVSTQEEYDALEPNTPYVDSKGNHGIKKGAAKKPAVQRVTGKIQ